MLKAAKSARAGKLLRLTRLNRLLRMFKALRTVRIVNFIMIGAETFAQVKLLIVKIFACLPLSNFHFDQIEKILKNDPIIIFNLLFDIYLIKIITFIILLKI